MATEPIEQSLAAGFEERDVNTRKVLYFFVFITVVLALTCLGIRALFGHFEKTARPQALVAEPFENDRQLPPRPRIQINPEQDIQNYLNSQQATLNSYGWVDRNQGLVRIPVDRAMQLTLQHGLPTRTSGNNSAASTSGETNTPSGTGPDSNTGTNP